MIFQYARIGKVSQIILNYQERILHLSNFFSKPDIFPSKIEGTGGIFLSIVHDVEMQENFVLPHPRAKNRLFVLQPAVELVPDVVWPNTGKTLQQLLDELETDERVMPLPTQPPFYVA